jgi:hypothetical protein
MEKMKNFRGELVDSILFHFSRFQSSKKDNNIQGDLVRLLDSILVFDYLKTWQFNLSNDLALYKRSASIISKPEVDFDLNEFVTRESFSSIKILRKSILKIQNSSKVILEILESELKSLKDKKDENRGIRVISLCLFFLDEELNQKFVTNNLKKMNLKKIFKDIIRVSLYNELTFNVPFFFQSCCKNLTKSINVF